MKDVSIDYIDQNISKSDFPGCNSSGYWGYTKDPDRTGTDYWTHETWIDLDIFIKSGVDLNIGYSKLESNIIRGLIRGRKIDEILND